MIQINDHYSFWDEYEKKTYYSNICVETEEFSIKLRQKLGSKIIMGRRVPFLNEHVSWVNNNRVYNNDIVQLGYAPIGEWCDYYGYENKEVKRYTYRDAVIKKTGRQDHSIQLIFLDNNEKVFLDEVEPWLELDTACSIFKYDLIRKHKEEL